MARPRLKIDPHIVEELAKLHCSNVEIAAVVGCSVDTLAYRFAEIIANGREQGKIKLRRLQWRSAENGNVIMQIFLGKQLLGQSEKIEQKIDETVHELSDAEIDARIQELDAKK